MRNLSIKLYRICMLQEYHYIYIEYIYILYIYTEWPKKLYTL
jgi:hypothetical protein